MYYHFIFMMEENRQDNWLFEVETYFTHAMQNDLWSKTILCNVYFSFLFCTLIQVSVPGSDDNVLSHHRTFDVFGCPACTNCLRAYIHWMVIQLLFYVSRWYYFMLKSTNGVENAVTLEMKKASHCIYSVFSENDNFHLISIRSCSQAFFPI